MPRRVLRKAKKGSRRSRLVRHSAQDELDAIELAGHLTNLELLDMFVEVSTPEVSDDENVPPTLPQLPIETRSVGAAEDQRAEFLRARFIPNDTTVPYYPLYLIPKYLSSCRRKFIRLRRYAKHCNFPYIFNQGRFWRDYVRVRDLYGHVGGRDLLGGLLSIYHYLNNETDSDESDLTDTDSESDSDSEPDLSPKKFKPNPDDQNQDPPPPPVPILV